MMIMILLMMINDETLTLMCLIVCLRVMMRNDFNYVRMIFLLLGMCVSLCVHERTVNFVIDRATAQDFYPYF